MYHFLRSKKGFTIMELFTCIIVLGILCAVAVPIYSGVSKKQKIQECENNCQMISTVIQEAMYGMMDNGKKQDSIPLGDGKKTLKDWVNSKTSDMVDLNINAADPYANMDCVPFNLTYTLGELRGGYRTGGSSSDYNDGCNEGHYLKKSNMASRKVFTFLANQEMPVCPFVSEKLYSGTGAGMTGKYVSYFVFEDGTVVCGCEECSNYRAEH